MSVAFFIIFCFVSGRSVFSTLLVRGLKRQKIFGYFCNNIFISFLYFICEQKILRKNIENTFIYFLDTNTHMFTQSSYVHFFFSSHISCLLFIEIKQKQWIKMENLQTFSACLYSVDCVLYNTLTLVES